VIAKLNLRNEPASNDDIRGTIGYIVGVLCLVVIGIFVCGSSPGIPESTHQPKDSDYNLLVRGFQAGQLNLDKQVPQKFADQPDPYNPQNVTGLAPGLWDLSYYKGKLFLYFGVTPALVLFWPYAAVTGHYLSNKAAVLILFSVGFFTAGGLLRAIWRQYVPDTNPAMAVLGMLSLGLATILGLWCNVYEVATTSGFAFTMLSLAAIWKASRKPKQAIFWILMASLAYGLAIGSRPSLLFGAVILLLPVFPAWCEAAGPGYYRTALLRLAAALGPIALIGLGLMFYNDFRFNNPFEFGSHYQLNGDYDVTKSQQFSFHYFWFNIRYYFFEPVRWSNHFPLFGIVPLAPLPKGYYSPGVSFGGFYGGILATCPVVLLALATPWIWKGKPAGTVSQLRWFLGTVFILLAATLLVVCLFFCARIRYESDFLSPLIILSAAGILGLERRLAGVPAWRRAARIGLGVLLVYSAMFFGLTCVETHGTADCFIANDLLAEGRLDEAEMRYQKALWLRPDNADALGGLGHTLFQKNQINQAIIQYQKALNVQPNFPKVNNDLAYCYLQVGRVDDAITQYQKAVELVPDSAIFHRGLGNALLQKGETSQGIAQYEKALEIEPDFAQGHNFLGYCLFQSGRMDEAIVHFRKAAELEPQSAVFHSALGNVLFAKGDVDGAMTEYQKALTLDPNSADVCKCLGDIFLQKGQMDRAIAEYQKALVINPNFPKALNNLGFCFLQTGRLDDAVVQYQKVIQLQPNYAAAYSNLGDAFHLKGMASEAVGSYQKAIELEPQLILPQTHLAWILASWPDASVRDGKKAVALAEQANQLASGQDPQILRALAAAYAETSRFPEAVLTAQKALALATAQSDAALANELKTEMGGYESNTPCRSKGE
jgi:tetratricopeptide (TPR) repeat protein